MEDVKCSVRPVTYRPDDRQPWPIWHLLRGERRLVEIFLGVYADATTRADEIPGAWVGHAVVTEINEEVGP